jgi:glycosyltransferase involved in cell wall biosynthesis
MTPHETARGSSGRPVVVVYREVILYFNEPYIRTQAEAVPRYEAHYVGSHRVARGVELPKERTIVLRDRYDAIDRRIDRVLRRVPAVGPLRVLQSGQVIARAAENIFLQLGLSPHIVRELRSLRPAVLHAHTGVSGAHALPLVRRLGVPYVVTFHGYDATASDEELARWPKRGRIFLRRRDRMKRAAARFIAVSGFIRDMLVSKGWPDDRIVVHYMGVDTQRFRPDPAARPQAEREPVIFFAGRLIEKKGLEYLIDAMRVVGERFPAAQLVVAGQGPLRQSLERRAVESGARVRFLGSVTPDEIREWMARAQVYCMPSVRASDGDGEGLPTVVVEAMASGLPVVATRHAGIPEAVTHGASGLLTEERDVAGLIEHLSAALADADARERMGAAGRRRVLEDFDHRRQAARLADIYDEVRAEHAASRASGVRAEPLGVGELR